MGELTRRKFDSGKDYETLTKWWEYHHGGSAPNLEYLSDTGLVIEIEGEPVAMVFLYHTNSKICWGEFFTVNPKSKKKDRDAALDYLIECCKEWAKKAGYDLIYVSTNAKKYIKRLKEQGFSEADKNFSHCFYNVKKENGEILK